MRELLVVNCTLGELIRVAREDKGLTRTKLAEFAGITPNSMVRYEMAGTSDGKYPPAKKLMKICEVLELDPRNVFDAIKYEDYLTDLEENPGDPNEIPYEDRFGLRFSDHFRTGDDWLQWKLSVKSIDDLNNRLDVQMGDHHFMDERLKRIENMLSQLVGDKQNGPGEDPSRSNGSDNAEVVGATSTSIPKGGG